MLGGFAHIHFAHVLDGPKQVALGEAAAVDAGAGKDRQGGIADGLHAFNGLANGIVIVQIAANGLGGQEKQQVQNSRLLSFWGKQTGVRPLFAQIYYTIFSAAAQAPGPLSPKATKGRGLRRPQTRDFW